MFDLWQVWPSFFKASIICFILSSVQNYIYLTYFIFSWAVQDLLMKASIYPEDLVKLYEEQGVWRENFPPRKGGFIPGDMAHEQFYDLPLKGAILRNRLNLNILENIGAWLPIRGNILQGLDQFIFLLINISL